MKRLASVLLAAVLGAFLFDHPAMAASGSLDELDDMDSKKDSKKDKKGDEDAQVKEIVRGLYAKSDIGGWVYLGNFLNYVKPGTSMGLAVGQDFVDKERSSMAWEFSFFQGIHNGTHYTIQSQYGCQGFGGSAPCVEGDLRTYTLLGSLEYSMYPARRLGIGLRAGGGILFSPLLMEETAYQEQVLTGEWHLPQDPGYHGTPHPVVGGGPTFEYYTKMAHFSIGGDVDALYAVGFDFGVSFCGYLKYTFN